MSIEQLQQITEYLEAHGWTRDDNRPDDARAAALHAEEIRERDWSDLEASARDFARVYGIPALLRCIADATK